MKVLLYADLDLSLPGGVETHVRDLAAGLVARGHQVDLFARPVPFPPFATIDRLDPDRYDVLHHHAGAWPRGHDVARIEDRYVRTLHYCVAGKMDAYVRRGRYRTVLNRGNWRARAEERAAIYRGRRFIAVSRRVRDEFARHHGLDPARAVVIPNGVTPGPARIGRNQWRARHGIGDEERVLLTIGRDDFVKGYDLLRRAWPAVCRAIPDALWVVVGGRKPGRGRGRRVTGPVSHEDVREWIDAADLGALPSYYEGCSVALLEMLAGGLFVLAHDVGDAAEAVGACHGGAIVPEDSGAWTEALIGLLADPPRFEAPRLSPDYHWEAVVEAVESVYRDR